MRQFDLSYSTQNGRLTFKALNENGERALWDVLSLIENDSADLGGNGTYHLKETLATLKRKGYTVRPARRAPNKR